MVVSREELEELVEELSEHKGRHTELITVYISAGYDCNSVQKQLEAEKSTAKNIKSTATRKNVIDALEKIVRYLKDIGRTPENGIGVFCGNVSQVEGQDDLRIWSVEPPLPIKVRLYRCDKDFVLEPLQEQLEISEIYGLIVMDRKESTLGVLEGKRIEMLKHITSGVPSKVRAGGQSSQRFHRITEGLTKEFYKRIADEAKNCFFGNDKVKGIIVGGPVPTKDEFLDNGYLMTQLAEKVIGRKDIGDTDESGLKELVEKSQDLLANQEIIREKKLIERFFTILGEKPELATYHYAEIKKALEYGAVEMLIVSKDLDKSILKELRHLAQLIDSKIETVSVDTEEGKQFNNLSGMGAILRFQIQ
jgi:peptide chain release factor subunit 1